MNEKKYILTEKTKVVEGHILRRIQAVRDFGDVKAGDLGGWIEKEENLSHNGLCWVHDEACVFEGAWVHSDARVFGNAKVYGNAQVFERAWVLVNAQVFGGAWVFENAKVYGNAQVFGCARVFGDAQVFGDAGVFNNAWVFNNAHIFENAQVSGMVKIGFLAKIESKNDFLVIGPIGSRDDYTTFYKTTEGTIWVSCGCFNGSIDDFKKNVKKKHPVLSTYRKEYLCAIRAARSHIFHRS